MSSSEGAEPPARVTVVFSARSVSLPNGSSSSLAVTARRRSRPGTLPLLFPRTWRKLLLVTPTASREAATPSFCKVAASSMCWVPTAGAPRTRASDCASIRMRKTSRLNGSNENASMRTGLTRCARTSVRATGRGAMGR